MGYCSAWDCEWRGQGCCPASAPRAAHRASLPLLHGRRFASSRLSPRGLAAAETLLPPASGFLCRRYGGAGRSGWAAPAQTLPKPIHKATGFAAGPDLGDPEMVEGMAWKPCSDKNLPSLGGAQSEQARSQGRFSPSIQPRKRSTEGHRLSDGAHFPGDPRLHQADELVPPDAAAAPRFAAAKALAQLGAATAEEPALLPVPRPQVGWPHGDHLLFIPQHIMGCTGAVSTLFYILYRAHFVPTQKKAQIG